MEERLEKQLEFIAEIDKLKKINRQTYISDGTRPENDAEHSWHMAVMAILLGEYANSDIDVLHVIKILLVHDLVEIDAGDTYAYDPEANKSKREREVAAAERIFNILPEDQAAEIRALWDEYEAGESAEAKFALSLDILQPVMLNELSGGVSWLQHGIREEAPRARISCIKPGSDELFEVASGIIDTAVKEGKIIPS